MIAELTKSMNSDNGLIKIINYEIVRGNTIWRFAFILLVIIVAIAAGKIAQHLISSYICRKEQQQGGPALLTIFFKCISKPISIALFAAGLFVCKVFLVFGEEGIDPIIAGHWTKISQAIAAIALAYALYRLVDVIEYSLLQWINKTKTKLDDMLVPVITKSLRVTVAIVAALWIADGILEANIRTILLGAGVGGVAVALAAKETIANFFGSVTIFADKPFQIDEIVKIGEHTGPVADVGFRSTRIHTWDGHLVTIPNSIIANSVVENISRRPFILRNSSITVTYDAGHSKTLRAVEIIKEILAAVPQVNTDPEMLPRVYFNDFKDSSLNISMQYWVKPPDWWLFCEINQAVNLEIMKRFEAEKIEFAFPTQTLYVKKE